MANPNDFKVPGPTFAQVDSQSGALNAIAEEWKNNAGYQPYLDALTTYFEQLMAAGTTAVGMQTPTDGDVDRVDLVKWSLDVAAGYAAATVNYLSAAGQAFAQDLQKWGTTPTQPTGTNEPPN